MFYYNKNLTPTVVPFVRVLICSMDRSATVNHDNLKQYIVNFNPID